MECLDNDFESIVLRFEEKTDSDNIPPLPSALEHKIKVIKVTKRFKKSIITSNTQEDFFTNALIS